MDRPRGKIKRPAAERDLETALRDVHAKAARETREQLTAEFAARAQELRVPLGYAHIAQDSED